MPTRSALARERREMRLDPRTGAIDANVGKSPSRVPCARVGRDSNPAPATNENRGQSDL